MDSRLRGNNNFSAWIPDQIKIAYLNRKPLIKISSPPRPPFAATSQEGNKLQR